MPCGRSGRRMWRRSSATRPRASRLKAVPHDPATQAPHEASARDLQVFPASPAAPPARAQRPEPDPGAAPVVGVLAGPMTALAVVTDDVAEIDAIVARSPVVAAENALDRSTGADHRALFTYL